MNRTRLSFRTSTIISTLRSLRVSGPYQTAIVFQQAAKVCIALVFLSSCAHQPIRPAEVERTKEVLAEVCTRGEKVKSVTGNLVASLNYAGKYNQFPANVKVDANSAKGEVRGPFGSLQGEFLLEGETLTVKGEKVGSQRDYRDFFKRMGLRLADVRSLFLGKIPCPVEWMSAELSWVDDNKLLIQTNDKTIVTLELTELSKNYLWISKLTRNREGTPTLVFEFSEPETDTGAPLKWKAQSISGAQQDSFQVQWKRREWMQ